MAKFGPERAISRRRTRFTGADHADLATGCGIHADSMDSGNADHGNSTDSGDADYAASTDPRPAAYGSRIRRTLQIGLPSVRSVRTTDGVSGTLLSLDLPITNAFPVPSGQLGRPVRCVPHHASCAAAGSRAAAPAEKDFRCLLQIHWPSVADNGSSCRPVPSAAATTCG